MALSRRKSNRVPALAVAACHAMLAALGLAAVVPAQGAAAGAASLKDCNDSIELDGTRLDATLRKGTNNATNLGDVKITGCDMEIIAKRAHATSLDFDDSNWTFTGDVRIRAGQQQSKLNSDEAVVQFRNQEIERITIKGNPAEFEQKRPDSDIVTRGRAGHIVYDAGPGTVSLQDDVWLVDGGKEFKGPRFVYDIRNAEVSNTRGASEGDRAGDRVHITINPKAMKDDKKPAQTTPSASGQNTAPPSAPVNPPAPAKP